MSSVRETSFAFRLQAVPQGAGPTFRRLAAALKAEILDRRPEEGARLPTLRTLAGRLGIHTSTVQAAYTVLEDEGLAASHVGRGSFVGRPPRDRFRLRFPPAVERAQAIAALHQDLARGHPDSIDLFSIAPEPGQEAHEAFQTALDRVMADQGRELLGYGGTQGLPALREEVARWLSRFDRTLSPENILITSGAQQALELAIRCFVAPGEALAAACPTYLNLIGTLESLGLRLLPVPGGPAGPDLEALDRTATEPRVRLLYVMPTFQNPTGLSLDRAQREAFLATARRAGLPVLEDDLEEHLRFEGEPVPSLHAMDREGRVVLAGSISKALFPGLRIGWITAPPESMDKLIALKRFSDLETSRLTQAALARFFAEADMDMLLREQRERLRRRRDRLVACLERHLPADCRWTRPSGGSTLWLELPGQVDGRELAAAARRQGLLTAPGDIFYPDRRRTGALRLSFARAPLDKIEEGVEFLGRLVAERLDFRPEEDRQTPVL